MILNPHIFINFTIYEVLSIHCFIVILVTTRIGMMPNLELHAMNKAIPKLDESFNFSRSQFLSFKNGHDIHKEHYGDNNDSELVF